MKNMKRAFVISLALTLMVFIYFLATGQSTQSSEFWTYAISLFVGVMVYLWFAGRRSK